MNLRNFWKDFNSNLGKPPLSLGIPDQLKSAFRFYSVRLAQKTQSAIEPWLPSAVTQMMIPRFTHYLEVSARPYRLSELTKDHLVLKFWTNALSQQEVFSQYSYFVFEAWTQFIAFQKKRLPSLNSISFTIEQIETEFYEKKLTQEPEGFEVQLKLFWPSSEIDQIQTQAQSHEDLEIIPLLSDRISVQFFDRSGLKLAHFSLQFKARVEHFAQITR